MTCTCPPVYYVEFFHRHCSIFCLESQFFLSSSGFFDGERHFLWVGITAFYGIQLTLRDWLSVIQAIKFGEPVLILNENYSFPHLETLKGQIEETYAR